MRIRKAVGGDIPAIGEIYGAARSFMASVGNAGQWINGYPNRSDIERDLKNSSLYVVETDGEIDAVFCFMIGYEPTYDVIEGSWLDESENTGVIHRIAVRRFGKGLAKVCFDWCFERCNNIRIDTHENNTPMRAALKKYGFSYRGVIYVAPDAPRVAYQKII